MRDQEPEKSLFECEELSHAILENSPECLGLLDATGRFLMINETGLRLLGADGVDAAYGTEWRLLWPERARPQLEHYPIIMHRSRMRRNSSCIRWA